ncbi:amino acid ABC transporter ATP-binding protein [Clostridium sp. BJN0001]|uniref:amino acid ABC transporter ATP-binding protein n=1 Tax=Clostridium sp. BJN0001 TaxID=2930219 RepID=UPI001FD35A8D|nr:amino acid ABC transporter ATP-binding protein [Clostridium sp. BJN0001]
MLNVSNLTKKFGDTEVLRGINFKISEGEILVIVGHSGGGKTTLLRCINELEHCDSGNIEVNGKKFCENGSYKNTLEIRKDIGLVFQGFNLFPHMNILENLISAPITVFNIKKDEAIKKARKILGFLGLSEKERNYPFELSGGQKQRVAIGRALMTEPKIMCFDEPTSALDPGLTLEVANLIKKLKDETKMAMLIITHDMDFARNVADKIMSMDQGVLKEGIIFDEIDN